MELIGAIVLIVFVWVMMTEDRRRNEQAKQNIEVERERERQQFDDDAHVLKLQSDFERANCDGQLPDSVRGRDLFIYRELMKPWFSTLLARKRFDNSSARCIRRDWASYISAREERARASFLGMMAFERGRSREEEEYAALVRKHSDVIQMIEDAFANEIGPQAQKQLLDVREMSSITFKADGSRY